MPEAWVNSRQLIQGEWFLRRQDNTYERTHLAADDENIKLFYILLVVKKEFSTNNYIFVSLITSLLVKRSLYSAKKRTNLLAYLDVWLR